MRALALLVVAPSLLGCAENVRPVLGGLKLGQGTEAFHVPVLENERLPFRYPRSAWEDGVGGETTLRIHITAEGTVDSVEVVSSSGVASLDSAAVSGARQLRYRPARKGETPVAVWGTLPVRYPMPEKADPHP